MAILLTGGCKCFQLPDPLRQVMGDFIYEQMRQMFAEKSSVSVSVQQKSPEKRRQPKRTRDERDFEKSIESVQVLTLFCSHSLVASSRGVARPPH